jgi:hypothetical protein
MRETLTARIRIATVPDSFGNVFGLIENPHFKIQKEK